MTGTVAGGVASAVMRRHPTSIPALALLAGSVLLASAACGAPAPSPAPTGAAPAAGPLIACMSLADAECRPFADTVIRELGLAGTVRWLRIGPVDCPVEPCPRPLAGSQAVEVLVDYTVGRLPESVRIDPRTTPLTVIARADWGLPRPFPPRSPRVQGAGPHRFALAHCGLSSGIDFDGSWWDPIGQIDAFAPEAVNSADGTMTLTSDTTATFVAPSGFRLELVRRVGGQWLPGCD